MITNPLLVKIKFISVFRLAREKYTLKELSKILGIDIPTLSRYGNSKSLPSVKRINRILPILLNLVDPLSEIKASLINGGFTFPELNNLLNNRPYLLGWIIAQTMEMLDKIDFDTILSIEGGGIAYAASLANLSGKRFVYAIRDLYLEGGIIETYTPLGYSRYPPKMRKYIAIPKNSIKKDNKVVIVDDISWSGSTVYTLYKLVKRIKATPRAIFLIAIFDDTLEELKKYIDVPINSFVVIPRKTIH
ncbi:MAG: hypothetical protein J7K21_02570 [Desulfurococcales archaeon]|nr:hypothetical protein [Desulfurococcales archaeon]